MNKIQNQLTLGDTLVDLTNRAGGLVVFVVGLVASTAFNIV